ncbi:MAG: HlyD family efflux transporter periplasmic adaptor subunit [Gammaproteobacteria bacterium]|nr:HlyD family efflux transporter periplasmic adaptor subunit [Gammaproteobacteria bacterium]
MVVYGFLIVLAMTLASCETGDGHDAVGLLEWERVALNAEVSETIIAIAVTKGQRVETGQTILELDRRRLDARHAQIAQQKAQAAARLAELRRGPRSEEIDEARARARGDESDLANAERELERVTGLVARKLASQESLDNARTQRDRARAQLEASSAALQLLLAGTTAEQLAQAEAQLAQADAQLREADIDIERLTLRAPRSGRVDDLPYHAGERPPSGATLAILLAGERPYARVYVPEPVRTRITPGSIAQVFIDGIKAPVHGTVRYVSSDAAFTPYFALTERDRSRLSYVAEIDLDAAAAADLPDGIPLEVDFDAAHTAGQTDGQ